jgi:hypothetical protein
MTDLDRERHASRMLTHSATAISELGLDLLARAWLYLLDWRALAAAGVPALTLRHTLGVPPLDTARLEAAPPVRTDALGVVEDWTARGTGGVLVGPVGCGKGYAATRWLLEHARAGRTCRWTHAAKWRPNSGHDETIALCSATKALVIDDIGVGTVSAWTLTEVNALVCLREDAGLPTIVISNLAQLLVRGEAGSRVSLPLLDERSIERMQGRIIEVEGDSLRSGADDGDKLESDGRGYAWQRAHGLIDLFGADLHGYPLTIGDREARHDTRHEVRFGQRLAVRLANARHSGGDAAAKGVARDACARVGVAVEAARARTVEVAARPDVDGLEALASATQRLAADVPRQEPRPAPREMSFDERLARQREISALCEHAEQVTRLPPDRASLRRMGYAVEQTSKGWSVRHGSRELATAPSEADGWAFVLDLAASTEIDTDMLDALHRARARR